MTIGLGKLFSSFSGPPQERVMNGLMVAKRKSEDHRPDLKMFGLKFGLAVVSTNELKAVKKWEELKPIRDRARALRGSASTVCRRLAAERSAVVCAAVCAQIAGQDRQGCGQGKVRDQGLGSW